MCIQGLQQYVYPGYINLRHMLMKCIQGLQQYVYPEYMYSRSYNLKTSEAHKVFPGSTAVCVSMVHAFKII